MKKRAALVLAVCAGLPRLCVSEERPVFRASSALVQVDAVVTGKDGGPATDLTADDFEIEEDGRRQSIVHVRYVAVGKPRSAALGAAQEDGASEEEHQERTIVLIVDDLHQSLFQIAATRQAARAFIDEQVEEGDRVAILCTGGGIGAASSFTADKARLRAVVQKIRFNPNTDTYDEGVAESAPAGAGKSASDGTLSPANVGHTEDSASALRDTSLALGTMGALEGALQGLREMSGRKSVVLLTGGFEILGDVQADSMARRLIDLANQASVVIYTVDSRGLTARSKGPSQMGWLADKTGGLSFRNQDLGRALARVASDQRGYYLIGYSPDTMTFRQRDGRPVFHHLRVKVKRPGLSVRARGGFVGRTEEEQPAARGSVLGALLSPFAASDIEMRLATSFYREASGPVIRALMHVDTSGLRFHPEPDGTLRANIEIMGAAFGAGGHMVGPASRAEEVRMREGMKDEVRRRGFVYALDLPLEHGGPCQVRFTFRDVASGRIGSASEFLIAPDLTKKRFVLSGLAVGLAGAEPGAGLEESQVRRQFEPGSTVVYGFVAYDATLDPATSLPRLTTRLRLFRDGKLVHDGEARAVAIPEPKDPSAVPVGGGLALGPEMRSGDYVLEALVTDELAKGKHARASRTIGFQIVEPESAAAR